MVADIPAILEKADTLPSISDQDVLVRESASAVRALLGMVKSVERWNDEFWKASPSPRAWSVPSCAVNPADVDPSNRVFPLCFEFESLNVAVAVVMCWSVAAQLYSNVIQIHDLVQGRLGRSMTLEHLLASTNPITLDSAQPLEPSSRDAPSFSLDKSRSIQDIQSEGTRMARYICQSLEYFHRTELGTYGGHATTYPSWSARQYFRLHPGHEREWSWLQNIHKMEGPGTRWGLSMMTFADIVGPLSRRMSR